MLECRRLISHQKRRDLNGKESGTRSHKLEEERGEKAGEESGSVIIKEQARVFISLIEVASR
jgi:hypothetical protein